jgi:hypothetical protein
LSKGGSDHEGGREWNDDEAGEFHKSDAANSSRERSRRKHAAGLHRRWIRGIEFQNQKARKIGPFYGFLLSNSFLLS